MTLRRIVLIATLLVLLADAGPAAAQDEFFVGDDIFHTPVAGVRSTELPVASAGTLVVEWEADPDTCAAVGRCGLRGMTAWRVPHSGRLFLFEGRRGARRLRSGYLIIAGGFAGTESPVITRVRGASGMCADSGAAAGFAELEERDGLVTLGIGEMEPSLVSSRCAGPMLEDLARALPVARVPFRQLRRGRRPVELSGAGTFLAHGLRGTVRSDVELRLGAPRRAEGEGQHPGRRRRVRYVSNQFRVASVSGEIGFEVAGATGAQECGALDSCGLAGTLRLAPAATDGRADLTAHGPARHGRRVARAGVGLVRGGVRRGFRVFGTARWEGPGRLEASIARGGEPPCTDTVAVPSGLLTLTAAGGRVEAEYLVEGAALRTRCPGPLIGLGPLVASGRLPLSAFGRRRVELRLTSGTNLLDDGWTGRTRPALTVVLERARILERVVREAVH